MQDIVLIVDDDAAVLTMLEKVVRSSGLSAECVDSGEKALELLAQHRYDLILMDVNMQGMDGFACVEAIRRRGIRTPIMIVSARQEDVDTLYGLDIGADDYITKPFNPITLGAKAKALIRRSRNALPGAEQVLTAGPFASLSTRRIIALIVSPTWKSSVGMRSLAGRNISTLPTVTNMSR